MTQTMQRMPDSANFGFLREHTPVLLQLATAAERAFAADPNTSLIKLRQLGEALAQDLAARAGIELQETTSQADLLWRLNRDIRLDPTIRELFHRLRIDGNKATHQFQTRHREAMDGLKVARTLAIWYHRSFGSQAARFKPGPFTPPPNPSHQLDALHTEIERLKRSKTAAEQRLRHEGYAYLDLRDYQIEAIRHIEQALADGQRHCLVAMATGTGKTRTIIGLMYRLLKAERFQRILYLVDRSALGQQAIDAFNDAPLEQNQSLSTIYNIAELGDMAAQAETRIQVATVQAMVRRVFQSEQAPPVDSYDCIIVDEAHRGYTLDQEMTDGELELRDQSQYLSSYRRVLDWFDATRIGMTATPAKHTTEAGCAHASSTNK